MMPDLVYLSRCNECWTHESVSCGTCKPGVLAYHHQICTATPGQYIGRESTLFALTSVHIVDDRCRQGTDTEWPQRFYASNAFVTKEACLAAMKAFAKQVQGTCSSQG